MKYYYYYEPDAKFNQKAHDYIYKYMINDNRFIVLKKGETDIIEWLVKNSESSDQCLIICNEHPGSDVYGSVSQYIRHNKFKMKILAITYDYWNSRLLYDLENYHIFTFATKKFLHFKKANVTYDVNLWSCYESSFIDINNEPINKIFIPGCHVATCYPERHRIKIIMNENKLGEYIAIRGHVGYGTLQKHNDHSYNIELNRYICCFASSIWVRKKSTNVVLLKVFEILAVSSLLLYPKSESEFLKKLGLQDNVHYMTIDMEDEEQAIKTIKYILDPDNREIIDQIRMTGGKFAKNNLTSNKKYDVLVELIKSKIEGPEHQSNAPDQCIPK